MKILTRMKLINWHRFENCIVDFGSSTLVSGENGAGKSTLLDAIQFVITCSSGSFNKAAHENGKRKLTGYIRCKSGKEVKPYERTGEISAHIALEFYEESRDIYFIIGAVVDSASEGQEVTVRYLIDNARLSEDMFMNGRTPRSISQFRAYNKNIRQWCKTQSDARKMVSSRLGRLQDKFFRLIPKALAFKPIDDIKDFVYSYVLDEKEVNIDGLRENVRTYQELEKTLESVRIRIAKLELIEKYHADAIECMNRDRMYEYFLARVDADITKKEIYNEEAGINSEEYRLNMAREERESVLRERDNLQEMEMKLKLELMQNREFLALEDQKKELELNKSQKEGYQEEFGKLKSVINKAMAAAEKLAALSSADPCIVEYRRFFANAGSIDDVAAARELIDRVTDWKKKTYNSLQKRLAEENIRLRDYEERHKKLLKRIEDLERNRLSYPEPSERLVTAIRQEFARLGRTSEPHVLCELLDITDESWRNAVEGYLNTQRFYVLVEPDNFDVALGIYDRLRRQGKVYGAGLINVQRMEAYDQAPEGSLASMVSSGNIYAARYINMVLGKVQMCERFEDLKKYPVSITKQCMRYQNRVASAIKPEIFSVPFIGKQAFKVQLAQARAEEKELAAKIRETASMVSGLEDLSGMLGTDYDIDVKYRLDVIIRLKNCENAIKQCEDNIRTLEKNTTIIQKQIQLDYLADMRKKKDREAEQLSLKMGGLENSIETRRKRHKELSLELKEKLSTLNGIKEAAGASFPGWNKEYEKQTEKRTSEKFRENYERQRKSNETMRIKAEDQMKDQMMRYKTEHDFGAAASMAGFPEFAAVYDRLRSSELLEYEGRVQKARETAEQEFREQFLARLQENMKQAQGEFRELNRALKDITFSNDKYEFLYMPSRRNRAYYEMIMDDFNILQGESIFSGVFHEEHKEVIEELFERLTISDDSNERILEEYTDYRSYMDYDIKIIHEDESFSYYSKVCEEKSGGETQTPFYVTVAASFVQLYRNCISGEAAGIVMFDEAFNNMDDERIGGVLEFINRLPLQMIISAPPEKIQYIAPSMAETLLIMTDGRVSYVEEYKRAVRQDSNKGVAGA